MSTKRRILVGDSHASGLAAAAARAGVPFVASQAFSGQRTSTIAESGWVANTLQLAQRMSGGGLGGAIDEVWVVSSGNDRAPDNLEPHVRSLQQQARGARLVWLGPPTATVQLVDGQHLLTTEKLEQLLPRDVFFDSRPMTRSGHAADGVHFTHAGYDAWWSAAEQEAWLAKRTPLFVGVGLGVAGLVAVAIAVLQAQK